jgi:hypothetical protein
MEKTFLDRGSVAVTPTIVPRDANSHVTTSQPSLHKLYTRPPACRRDPHVYVSYCTSVYVVRFWSCVYCVHGSLNLDFSLTRIHLLRPVIFVYFGPWGRFAFSSLHNIPLLWMAFLVDVGK